MHWQQEQVSRLCLLMATTSVFASILVFHASALPALPTYSTIPCPTGWTYSSFDDSCNRNWNPKPNRSTSQGNLPTLVSYYDAISFCAGFNASLPIITNVSSQLAFYQSLVGTSSGARWWIGVHANKAIPYSQQWITRTGRSTGFVFDWDLKRNQPNAYDRCIVMHQNGTNQYTRVYGGNGKMVAIDCEEKASVVCTKQRVPVSIEGINDAVAGRVEFVATLPLTFSFYGSRIPNGTLVTFQSMDPLMLGNTLQDRRATHCASVTNVSGAHTPFLLTPQDTLVASASGLCNATSGSCNRATITIPGSWPFTRGARYSFCFYTPLPFATPYNLTEYQYELLGSNAYIEVVQRDIHFLQDVCTRRREEVDSVLGTGVSDAARLPESAPYEFESPIEGRYNDMHRTNERTVLPWGR